jgi:hypothetical protein
MCPFKWVCIKCHLKINKNCVRAHFKPQKKKNLRTKKKKKREEKLTVSKKTIHVGSLPEISAF